MWIIFALLSAVFAALTSILAKIGIAGVNSNLATAIRTVVVLVMAWGMVFLTHAQSGISEIGRKLDFPYFIGIGHRRFLAVLLQSFAAWRS
ncbi:MAG: EamA family transporter [Anaerovoracaceae bacterium]